MEKKIESSQTLPCMTNLFSIRVRGLYIVSYSLFNKWFQICTWKITLDPYLPQYKNQLKLDALNVTMNILNSKKTWGKCHVVSCGNNFSDMTPKYRQQN